MSAIQHTNSLEGLKALFTGTADHAVVYFAGNADAAGSSWCPDCNAAWPQVKAKAAQLGKDTLFVHCEVGDRPTWKDPKNEFRLDAALQLQRVPTLALFAASSLAHGKLPRPKRVLVEDQCNDAGLLDEFFDM
eukprot:m.194183 g.194183  ORF g.194183 m.194183 type:complete len:133 (-) comp10071_c5_seq2:2008-2406(-)